MAEMSDAERWRLAEAVYAVGGLVLRRIPRHTSLTVTSTLATLERAGPSRVTDLAEQQGVSQPTMSEIVSGLVRDGFAERSRDVDDKRVTMVTLTSAGAAELRSRRRVAVAAVATLLADADLGTPASVRGVVRFLERLRDLDLDPRRRSHASFPPEADER